MDSLKGSQRISGVPGHTPLQRLPEENPSCERLLLPAVLDRTARWPLRLSQGLERRLVPPAAQPTAETQSKAPLLRAMLAGGSTSPESQGTARGRKRRRR